jgi:abequosyltransferase
LSAVHEEIQASQLTGLVEVVVSDNASDDDTETLVGEFATRGIQTSYFRQSSNVGFGRNLTNAIHLAKGTYCWLMGSDDVPSKGALSDLVQYLAADVDVLIGPVVTNGRLRRLLFGASGETLISDTDSILAYLGRCSEISSLFAFMSAIVVRKSYWDAVPSSDNLIAHPYTHQIRLFRAMVENSTRLYNLERAIVVTGDEGNEWDAEISKHFELDCKTINYIASEIFSGDARINQAIGAVFYSQYGTGKLIRARAGMSNESWCKLVPILRYWGYAEFLLRKTKLDFAIFRIYKIAKRLKRWGRQC